MHEDQWLSEEDTKFKCNVIRTVSRNGTTLKISETWRKKSGFILETRTVNYLRLYVLCDVKCRVSVKR